MLFVVYLMIFRKLFIVLFVLLVLQPAALTVSRQSEVYGESYNLYTVK